MSFASERLRPHPPHGRPEVRLAAAIGWLCLTEEPIPEDPHQAIDTLATDERAHAMDTLPWMYAAAGTGEPGLLRCMRRMIHPEEPEPRAEDSRAPTGSVSTRSAQSAPGSSSSGGIDGVMTIIV
ncbi:hypothetical protein SLA_0520 [Streptomyces laurentii]|uniref:Uncharacterized protein n=1 Tax=Streptomyces laurentii TaxID=39478 RepID=A0A160NUH9_STRLU|nr:hypothetical protein SLA_0520 [Streptomyces laurentii]